MVMARKNSYDAPPDQPGKPKLAVAIAVKAGGRPGPGGDEQGPEAREISEPGQSEEEVESVMNDEIQEVSDKIDRLIKMAQDNGVYNDRQSLRSLQQLKQISSDVHDAWMGSEAEGEAKEPEAAGPKPGEPKLISTTRSDGAPPGPEAPSGNFNPYGGQIFYPDRK